MADVFISYRNQDREAAEFVAAHFQPIRTTGRLTWERDIGAGSHLL